MNAAARPVFGTILVAAAALCWSSAGVLSRLIDTGSWTTLFWRSLTSAIFLFLAICVTRRGQVAAAFRTLIGHGLSITLFQTAGSMSFILALMNTTVATALIIMATAPLFAAVLARIFLHEAIRPKTAIATGIAIVGIAIMVSEHLDAGRIFGNAMALMSALSFASMVVAMRRHREVELIPAVCLSMVVATLIALPIASAELHVGPRDLALLTIFGVGEQGLGLLLFVYGVRHIPAVEVALITLIECIMAPIWVWIFIQEEPGPRTLLGAGIVVGAVLINILADLRPARAVTQPTR